MEFLQVRDFGKSGLNTDLPAWDLPLSFLTNAQNYRIFNNKIFGFGGTKKHVDLPGGFNAYHVLFTPTPTDNYWMFAGDQIWVYDGTTFTQIGDTLPNYAHSPNGWTNCKLGRVPILNNRGYYPTYWNPQETDTKLAILPFDATDNWEAKQWSCRAMRSFGPYLIALNMKEGVDEYPDTVRWSHPAERNGIPPTWDETDPASLAGINVLGGDGGDIIDGLALRNSFVIYRDNGITVLDYSNDSYVFNARNLTSSIHIANANCISEVKGMHFVVCSNDVVAVTGDQVKSLMHERIRVRYASVVNQDAMDFAYAVHNTTTKEFWAFVPTGDAIYPSEAWVYNYKEDTWSIHDVNLPPHADFGNLDSNTRIWGDQVDPGLLPDIWDETWDTATGNWARKNNSVFNSTMLGPDLAAPSSVQLLDQFNSETDYLTVLERTDYNLTNMQDVNTITRIYPHIKGTSEVTFTVGSQDHAGAPVRWKPSVKFDPKRQRKIDVRTTGELFSFKITVGTNSSFEFSGMDIEYVQDGLR